MTKYDDLLSTRFVPLVMMSVLLIASFKAFFALCGASENEHQNSYIFLKGTNFVE